VVYVCQIDYQFRLEFPELQSSGVYQLLLMVARMLSLSPCVILWINKHILIQNDGCVLFRVVQVQCLRITTTNVEHDLPQTSHHSSIHNVSSVTKLRDVNTKKKQRVFYDLIQTSSTWGTRKHFAKCVKIEKKILKNTKQREPDFTND
jgi:hypothetical protein